MNLAAILDLKIFTNTINKYKNYQYYSFKTFFYSLYLNNVKNFHCRPFWIANCTHMGNDRFEISIHK